MEKTRKKDLLEIVNTSVDRARKVCRHLEAKGTPLTVGECEWCLARCEQATLRKLIEGKARRAFRESVKNQIVSAEFVGSILWPVDELAAELTRGTANYSTLRKAFYLASDPAVCELIRREIGERFPWGLQK